MYFSTPHHQIGGWPKNISLLAFAVEVGIGKEQTGKLQSVNLKTCQINFCKFAGGKFD
jgi:hypothetical protein